MLEAYIEADSLTEAETIAEYMDGGEFSELEGSGEWKINWVEESK